MNPCIKKMQYAVRGPLVIRATELEKVCSTKLRREWIGNEFLRKCNKQAQFGYLTWNSQKAGNFTEEQLEI